MGLQKQAMALHAAFMPTSPQPEGFNTNMKGRATTGNTLTTTKKTLNPTLKKKLEIQFYCEYARALAQVAQRLRSPSLLVLKSHLDMVLNDLL